MSLNVGLRVDPCSSLSEDVVKLAKSLGVDEFRPYLGTNMEAAIAGMQSGNAPRRRDSMVSIGAMAVMYGVDVAEYLPRVVPVLFALLNQRECDSGGVQNSIWDSLIVEELADVDINTLTAMSFAQTEDSIGAFSNAWMTLVISRTIAGQRALAADTLGMLCAATCIQFKPHAEDTVIELTRSLMDYYEGVRRSATNSLLELVKAMHSLSYGAESLVDGLANDEVMPIWLDMGEEVLSPLLDMYETEEDMSVVSALCVGLAETVDVVGHSFIKDRLENVCKLVEEILGGRAPCQTVRSKGANEEALKDEVAYGSMLLSSAGDLVAALVNALGKDFENTFATLFPLIRRLHEGEDRSPIVRSCAIGILAEVISGMKAAITPWTKELFNLIHHALQDDNADVFSNAAFAVGLLFEHSLDDLSPLYSTILNRLVLALEVGSDATRPNAVGAVSRLIVRNDVMVPLNKVLPSLVGALPLHHDFLENRPLFCAIFHLFHVQPGVLARYIDQLLPVFAHVLDSTSTGQLDDETYAELLKLVKALSTKHPRKFLEAGLVAYV